MPDIPAHLRLKKPRLPKPADLPDSPILPIYFTLVTDGPVPGEANLLHVSAQYSPDLRWERNILPQNGRIRAGCGIGPELRERLATGALLIRDAMRELTKWLDRFKGIRLPVTSAVAYWHLVFHLRAVTGADDFPLLLSPLDVNSFWAGAHGDLSVSRRVRGKDPWKAFTQRESIVRDAIAHVKENQWLPK